MMERLDKILSSQGICSRKEAKNLVKEKRIKINGDYPKKSDIKLDPECDIIELDGKPFSYSRFIYIMMNKPEGVLSASNDKNAKTVIDLLPPELVRPGLFPAGRLDKDTTGFILITNDGELAHNMLSPKKHIPKLYSVMLDAPLSESGKASLENGITLLDGTVFMPAKIQIPDESLRQNVLIEICEGKFHQVKKMFEHIGLTVLKLKRIRMGGLELDLKLSPGECKVLTKSELDLIFSRDYN